MTPEAIPLVIDLGAIAGNVRRRAYLLAAGLVAGGLMAAGVVFFYTPRFDGRALVLIKTSGVDPTSLVKSKLGPIGELMPSSLGGGADEELQTELSLLSSRAVLGAVVDSLRLQVVPRSPSRVPANALIDSAVFQGRFAPIKTTVNRGLNTIPQGRVWAKQPADVRLTDREDAIDDLIGRLSVKKSGGSAVEIRYGARDSLTAAAVPNLISAIYMARRKTVDRGLNQRRLEFLSATADSVRLDLRASADVLARVAEANKTGTAPDISARALADASGSLQARMSELRGSARALDSLIGFVQARRMDARSLAGFPELLKSPALNDLISQVARLETERTVLLGRAAESAPAVSALSHARDSLVAQILPIALAFRSSLQREIASADQDLGRINAEIARLPGQAAAVAKEQAEVTRLAAMNAGMGAQVLEARLAAMVEGGDVRMIDEAVPPRRVTFPRPLPTIAIGLLGGLMFGLVGALLTGSREIAGVVPSADSSTRLRIAQARSE